MAKPQADYTHMYDYIYKIDNRIFYIDKDAEFIEGKISEIEKRRKEHYEELHKDAEKLHVEITRLKAKMKNCHMQLIGLGHELKNAVKIEQAEAVQQATDAIPFLEYLTVNDLKRGSL